MVGGARSALPDLLGRRAPAEPPCPRHPRDRAHVRARPQPSVTIRLWHDDIRRPPDESWTWARTNKEAMEILGAGEVVEISMDHDLGLHEIDPDASLELMAFAGRSPDGSGYDLVCWMCENGVVPAIITIHSWNP